MRPLTCLVAAGLFAVAFHRADAATVAYGEAFDTLYRIDLEAHTAVKVGTAGTVANRRIGNISGLTAAGDGSVYAISGSHKALLRVDTETGSASIVGSLGLDDQGSGQYDALDLGMTAGCDGGLWLSSGTLKQLLRVDPDSGATSVVGATGHALTGIVAHGDRLFGAAGKGDDTFYRVDPATGAATAIGAFGPEVTRWVNSVSMSYGTDGTLWAVLNYVPPSDDNETPADWSDLATIDPATGRVHVVGPIIGPASLKQIGMKGFTAGPPACTAGTQPLGAPVDAPWMLGLLAALLALVAGRAARRCAD